MNAQETRETRGWLRPDNICGMCDATGVCETCNGAKWEGENTVLGLRPCRTCNGTGKCPDCAGSGAVESNAVK